MKSFCKVGRRLIEEAVDGYLPPEKYKQLLIHVTSCSYCYKRLRAEIAFRKLLRRAFELEEQKKAKEIKNQLNIIVANINNMLYQH